MATPVENLELARPRNYVNGAPADARSGRFSHVVDPRTGELNEAECRDTGKPPARMAEDETPVAADRFRFFAGAARTLQGPTSGEFLADHTSVVDGFRQDDEMVRNEVFGPVIAVQTFSDEADAVADAVAKANGVRCGLASSVWTSDHGRAMRMSKRLDFGVVWVNTHIPFVSEMPHGGFRHSGYGKDLSVFGLHDYLRVKHVMHYIGE